MMKSVVRLNKDITHYLDKKPEPKLYRSKKQVDRLIELHKLDFNVAKACVVDLYNKIAAKMQLTDLNLYLVCDENLNLKFVIEVSLDNFNINDLRYD